MNPLEIQEINEKISGRFKNQKYGMLCGFLYVYNKLENFRLFINGQFAFEAGRDPRNILGIISPRTDRLKELPDIVEITEIQNKQGEYHVSII